MLYQTETTSPNLAVLGANSGVKSNEGIIAADLAQPSMITLLQSLDSEVYLSACINNYMYTAGLEAKLHNICVHYKKLFSLVT